MSQKISLTECPRDAMQGLSNFIPTDKKIAYHNALLKVGFDLLDFGSFVSPKAIPQLKDTAEVVAGLELENTTTALLAIIANERGAKDACGFEEIKFLGYPFSISETFQKRNTNATIEESLDRVKAIQELCIKNSKELQLYISMGFGNPYGDPYHEELVAEWINRLNKLEVSYFALSDTIGVSEKGIISRLFNLLTSEYPDLKIGAHFHTTPDSWEEKVKAAHESGCIRFDSAIGGIGGCPMAAEELTGNMATENLLDYFYEKGVDLGLNKEAFEGAKELANRTLLNS